MQTNFVTEVIIFFFSLNVSIIFESFSRRYKSHLAWSCWSDCAAVRSTGESQSCGQLALRYWPRARRSTVAQRHWTHSCWGPHSVGGTCWAALLQTFTHRNTFRPSSIIGFSWHCSCCSKQSDSRTGNLPHHQTCPQTWSLLPDKSNYLYICHKCTTKTA